MKTSIQRHAGAGLLAIALAMPAFAQTLPAPSAARTCNDMQVSIYFPAYETALSPQSDRVIDAAAEQLKGCQVQAVSVEVLSEEAHTDEDAAALSEARAETVIAALLANGIEPSRFEADMTRVNAAAASAAPMVEPMARRVSIAFEVGPGYGV